MFAQSCAINKLQNDYKHTSSPPPLVKVLVWYFLSKSVASSPPHTYFEQKRHFFSPSHISPSTLRSGQARIMTCQCLRSSAISVVIWFLAISSFTRSLHLGFGLPRFRFPSTVICNIFLVASSLTRLCTCPNHLNLFSENTLNNVIKLHIKSIANSFMLMLNLLH